MDTSDFSSTTEGQAAEFLGLWESSPAAPDVFQFLATRPYLPVTEQIRVLRIDQKYRWKRGEPLSIQRYLREFPDIASRPELIRMLVEGDRRGRRESQILADELFEGLLQHHPSQASTQIVQP